MNLNFEYWSTISNDFSIFLKTTDTLAKDDNSNTNLQKIFKENNCFPKKYCYFMIKPDGARYFSEIIKLLKEKFKSDSTIAYLFPVYNWEILSKTLYSQHYENVPNFGTSFQSNVNATIDLFGNTAIICLLEVCSTDYIETLKTVLSLKNTVRDNFCNNGYAIICDLAEMPNIELSNLTRDTIKLETSLGEKKVRNITVNGYHEIHKLNMVHCPDPDLSLIFREFKILQSFGIISKPLASKDYADIIHSKTFNVLHY